MPMPWFESLISGDTFSPQDAQTAGFLDQIVDDDVELTREALATAEALALIPRHTFLEMRGLARGATVDVMRQERNKLSASS
jgi:enoyl-CoA hydratase/carnithine racemase